VFERSVVPTGLRLIWTAFLALGMPGYFRTPLRGCVLAVLLRLISAVGAGAYRCGLGYGGCDDGFGAVIAIDGMHKMASISAAGMNKVLSYLALKNGGLEL
jgi:hypothetical protein